MKTVSRRARALAALGVTGALAAGLVVAVPTVAQAVASEGYSGQVQGTFSGTLSSLPAPATATKTQHKVWYAGGVWWAAMKNQGGAGLTIHRLDSRETGSPKWTDTNVVIDARNGTSSDALYNATANKLFIASHILTARNTDVVTTNANAILTRYSLVDGAWIKDEGWPITIVASRGLSSLAIAQMTDGKIMATYVYNRRPYATNTNVSANGIVAPTFVNNFVVQWTKNTLNEPDVANSTTLTGDDVSAITAADGYVTIVYSNQRAGFEGFYAARHRVGDSFGSGNFFGTRLTSGVEGADNHISLVTDPQGGSTSPVYAIVKTSLDDTFEADGVTPRTPDPTDPLLRVLKIQPRSGGTVLNSTNAGYVDVTQNVVITTVAEKGTRPALSLDNTRRRLDVFYSAPADPSLNTNVIGVINHKSIPLSGAFTPSGANVVSANSANTAGGTTSKPDGQSDPTVSAQPVNAASGTIVLSTDTTVANLNANPLQTTRRYWWNDLFRAPTAAFTAEIPVAADNTLGLRVNFTSNSLGLPTSYAWDFGDGGSSTSANPTHTYASAGSKTVSLTVNNGTGPASTVTKTVVVGQKPVARFTAKFPDKQKLLIALTDASTGAPDSVEWDFGDGTPKRTVLTAGATVRHTYAKAGKYRIVLKATNGAGTSSVNHPVGKTTIYYYVVTATPSKVAKPTRLVTSGRKVVVSWKVPNTRGLTIDKYQVTCRATGSVRSVYVNAKDSLASLGKVRKGTVSLLTAGKTYSCTVKAHNGKGWNLPSSASTSFKARA